MQELLAVLDEAWSESADSPSLSGIRSAVENKLLHRTDTGTPTPATATPQPGEAGYETWLAQRRLLSEQILAAAATSHMEAVFAY